MGGLRRRALDRVLVPAGLLLLVVASAWWGWAVYPLPADRRQDASGFGSFVLALVGTVALLGGALARVVAHRPRTPQVAVGAQVDAAGDRLAERTAAVWSEQARLRGIHAPAPVRVRWTWAGEDVVEPRDALNASPGLGTDPRPLPGAVPGAPVLGSGLVTRLHDEVYARLRHGRLVVTGGAGAGKTGAMVLLLLDCLRHRDALPPPDRARVPVPVWLTLGSWDVDRSDLRSWVVTTLARDHPFLTSPDFGPDVIGRLLDTGRLALFLDGLDELPPALRGRALQRLQAGTAGVRVVVGCRSEEYAAARREQPWPCTAVVDLLPVRARAAEEYLLAGRTGYERRTWQRVTARLQHADGALAGTLSTPLMLSLARAAHARTDPAPLLAPALGTERALREHLLDQVLVRAYPDPADRARATWWLGWIAARLGPARDLAWWRIAAWVPLVHRRTVAWLAAGLPALALALLAGMLLGGAVQGLAAGLVVGFGSWLTGGFMAEGDVVPHTLVLRRPGGAEVRLLAAGMLAGAVGTGLTGAFGAGLRAGPAAAVVGAVGTGLMLVPVGRVWGAVPSTSSEATPRSLHRVDVRARFGLAAVTGAVLGVVLGLATGLVSGLAGGPAAGLGTGLVVAAVAVPVAALVVALGDGAARTLRYAEIALRAHGHPVRFLPLLEAAEQRQVLRRVGVVYQFRHADLQDRLAERHRQAGAAPG